MPGLRPQPRRRSSEPSNSDVDPDDGAAAETAALRILNGAAQSSRQLRRRLEERGYSPETAVEVTGRLETGGWVNDSGLAESVARRRLGHGFGRRRIAADLVHRGLDAEVIGNTLAGIDAAQEGEVVAEMAARLRRRLPAGRLDQAQLRRLAAALQRRGFDHASIRAAVRQIDADDLLAGEALLEG